MSNSLWPFGLELSRFLYLWDYPGKNTGVGCHALLQGIFPTQGLNPCLLCLLHRQATLVPTGVQVYMYICVYILSYSSLLWSCWNLRQIICIFCAQIPHPPWVKSEVPLCLHSPTAWLPRTSPQPLYAPLPLPILLSLFQPPRLPALPGSHKAHSHHKANIFSVPPLPGMPFPQKL